MCDLGEDHVSGGGPDNGLRFCVVVFDVIDKGGFVFNGLEDASANTPLGDLAKPAFDLIEPGATGGSKMQVITRMR